MISSEIKLQSHKLKQLLILLFILGVGIIISKNLLSPNKMYIFAMAITVLVFLAIVKSELIFYIYLLLLPFHNFLPDGSHQLFLSFILGVLILVSIILSERRFSYYRTPADKYVALFIFANAFSCLHSLLKVTHDYSNMKFILRVFASYSASIIAYFLIKYWYFKLKKNIYPILGIILLSCIINLGFVYWYIQDNGWSLDAIRLSEAMGDELRAQLFYRYSDRDFLELLAFSPGYTNGKPILFLTGFSLLLSLLILSERLWIRAVSSVFLLPIVLANIILMSRGAFLLMIMLPILGMIITIKMQGNKKATTTKILAILFILAIIFTVYQTDLLGKTILWRFKHKTYTATPGGRIDYNLTLLNFLSNNGGIFFGCGFDIIEHNFPYFTHKSTFNPHNGIMWVIANSGIFVAMIYIYLLFQMIKNGWLIHKKAVTPQDEIVGLTFFLFGVMFVSLDSVYLIEKWPQYFTLFWIFLSLSELEKARLLRKRPRNAPITSVGSL